MAPLNVVQAFWGSTPDKLADDKSVFFLDINQEFLEDDGTLSKDIMPDLLHLSEAGYEIWAKGIEAKSMGSIWNGRTVHI